jgi:hypothetical protein
LSDANGDDAVTSLSQEKGEPEKRSSVLA